MSHTSDPSFDGRLSPSTFGPSALSLGEDRAGKRKQEDDCDSDDPFACSSKRSKESPKDQVITDKATLDALDNLTHHATRFNVETTKMDVCTLIQWHLTNLVRPSQLVFAHYYQRERDAGWTEDQESQYLRTVLAGQASTPFVINIKRAEARLMDGGHRLHALVRFWNNEVPMKVGQALVYFKQLPPEDQEVFKTRKLQVTEFKLLPLKDEVEIYLRFNSGLPFSLGERLYATRHINPVTKLADKIVQTADIDMIRTFCKIMGKDCTGKGHGRKHELLVQVFLVYHLYFRKSGEPIIPAMAETFVDAICKFNKENEDLAKGHFERDGKTLDECKDRALLLLRRTLDLYTSVSNGPSPGTPPLPPQTSINAKAKKLAGQTDCRRLVKQTDFRRLVICVLAVAEIPEQELDPERFSRFVQEALVAHSQPEAGKDVVRLHHILTSNQNLRGHDIQRVVDAYLALSKRVEAPEQSP